MNKNIISHIKHQLSTNSVWAVRGLIKIYEYQTEDEKNVGTTFNLNGVGFNGVDSQILSSFAQQVNNGRTLSPKQMAIVFKKIPRYWKQIANMIPENKMKEMEQKLGA